MILSCQKCGTTFYAADDEGWKRLCLPCWKTNNLTPKPSQTSKSDNAEVMRLRSELTMAKIRIQSLENQLRAQQNKRPSVLQFSEGELKRLRILVHPDKHAGSPMATAMSQKLNELLK